MINSTEELPFAQTVERNLIEFKKEIIEIYNEYLKGNFDLCENKVTMKEAIEKRTDKLVREIDLMMQLEDKKKENVNGN